MHVRIRRPILASAILAIAATLPGASLAAAPSRISPQAFSPTGWNLNLGSPIITGLSKPVLLTHAGDGSGRLYVVEQVGRIKVFDGSGSALGTLLNISSFVSKGSEQGLLGLAFHPDFETNRKFYVNFTMTNGDTAINEYRASANGLAVVSGSARRVITIDQPYSNHNGGHIAFGPDGYLYIGMGDGGSAGDPGNRAQSLNSLLGKMLRINVNGKTSTRGYLIPSTNPYVGKTGLDQIWSRGLRNPWRWSFDRANGNLWIADVGQRRYEEVNRSIRVSTGAGRAANYGWRVMEGRHCYSPSSGCNTSGKLRPLVEYSHASGRCSITGGYVYRGSAHPDMVGGYFYADYCSGEIFVVNATAAYPAVGTRKRDTALLISSFGEDEAGELYVVSLGGSIYRMSAG